MNKTGVMTMRDILTRLSQETIYVDDKDIEYVVKYLKEFVDYEKKRMTSGIGPGEKEQ